eukprot:822243-Rhodomonas_salina.1
MSGTGCLDGATCTKASTGSLLRVLYAMSGTEIGYAATRLNPKCLESAARLGISLRFCDAMSGTDVAYGVSLRARYAMSGTDAAYGVSLVSRIRRRGV